MSISFLVFLALVIAAGVWLASEDDAPDPANTPTQLSFDDLLQDLEQESAEYLRQVHSLYTRH
jgi:hypothetical protein